MSNIFAENCKKYLESGYSVIPDRYQGKNPLIKGWTQFSSRFPTNIETENWALSFDKSNIALCLGEASGIIAVDVDTIDEKQLEIISKLLPKSPCEKIGAKGYTRFYRFKGEPTSVLKSENGEVILEVLSTGKKTTIPPSIHTSGVPYRWVGKTLLEIQKGDLPFLPPHLLPSIELELNLTSMHIQPIEKRTSGRHIFLGALTSQMIADKLDISAAVLRLLDEDKKQHEQPLFTDPKEFQSSIGFVNALDFYTGYLKSINNKRVKENLVPELPSNVLIDVKTNSPKLETDFPTPTGLLGDIFNFILAKSYVEQPVFALSGALALMGTLASRKFTFQGATPNTYILNIADSGCVDADTEFLTTSGWKKISDWKNDPVMQYNPNNNLASFTENVEYIKLPCDKMTHFKTKYGVDQVLSDEHKVLYVRKDRIGFNVKRFSELKDMHNKSSNGFSGKFLTTFNFEDGKYNAELSDDQLRLQVAFNADGTFPKTSNRPNIQVKKEYKKKWLEQLLKDTGTVYSRHDYDSGYTRFRFHPPVATKSFGDIQNYSKRQLEVICDECVKWDGDRVNTFRTSKKKEADFIQTAFAILGKRSTISLDDREGHGTCYAVRVAGNDLVGISSNIHIEMKDFIPKDGFKYCFTVPTGFLVLRRNDRIFLTGNSGKDSCQQVIKEVLAGIKGETLLGATSYPSEASITINLDVKPVRLDIIDEASGFLHIAVSGNAPYQVGIGDTLCELYSCSDSYYLGKILASNNGQAVGACYRPHLNLFCSTTYKGISESLTRATLEKGLFARFLTFFGENNRSGKRVIAQKRITSDLKDRLQEILYFENPLFTGNNKLAMPAYELTCSPEANDKLDVYHRQFDTLRIKTEGSSVTRPVISRLYQQMMKIVLISAIANKEFGKLPEVTVKDVDFGYKVVMYFYQSIESFIEQNLFDSKRGKDFNSVYRLILDRKDDGILSSELTGLTKSLTIRDRQEIIRDLIASRKIEMIATKDPQIVLFKRLPL